MSKTDENVAAFIERTRELYTLPAVAVKVLELTNNPKVDVAALKACIENDPALTTKILRVVNSSLFGLSREVSDLNQAIALLGTKPLKLLVLGFSLPEQLFVNVASDVLSQYWRRTLTKAVAAREICETLWHQPGDEAFIGGLLGDLGSLVLLQDLGESYARFLKKVAEENGDLLSLETSALGFNHVMLSAELLCAWKLPEALVSAISALARCEPTHRLPQSELPLAQQLHLAELLAQLVSECRINVLPNLLELGEAYCKLTRGHITSLVQTLGEKVDQLADVLSLHLPDGQDYCEVLLEAHRQMSDLAVEAAVAMSREKCATEATCQTLLDEAQSLRRVASDYLRSTATAPRAKREEAATLVPHASHKTPATSGITSARPADIVSKGPGSPLSTRIGAAVAECRERRCELSMLAVGVDRYQELLAAHGMDEVNTLCRLVRATCELADHPFIGPLELQDGRFAMIFLDCDRCLAVQLASELVRRMRIVAATKMPYVGRLGTISVGAATVAVPPPNFDPQMLIESAERCLYGAQSCGGNSVKSIEI